MDDGDDGDGGGAPRAELQICKATATQGRHNILPLDKQMHKGCCHHRLNYSGGFDGIFVLRI